MKHAKCGVDEVLGHQYPVVANEADELDKEHSVDTAWHPPGECASSRMIAITERNAGKEVDQTLTFRDDAAQEIRDIELSFGAIRTSLFAASSRLPPHACKE